MKPQIKKLSIILPYHKEEKKTLINGIQKIRVFLKKRKIPYEIIISQNGTDRRISLQHSYLKVIHNKRNGLGLAIKNATTVTSGDWTYFLSCEVPFNLTDLKIALNSYYKYDLIIGSKLHPKSIYKITFFRKLISYIFSKLTRLLLSNFKINDPNGTLFAKSTLFNKYAKEVKANDFFFETEFVYLFEKNHHKIAEVPVTYIKKGIYSTVTMIDGLHYLQQLFSLKFRD